jgi:adenine/guanine phosphoribosyltransferase-like PRPP-binding protein
VGKLVETLGGDIVGFGFLIEIAGLGGRARFDGRRVESLTAY